MGGHSTLDQRRSTGLGRVLVIDDDQPTCRFLEETLRDAGYEVQSMPDGLQALQRVGEFAPDVILLDLVMPWMNGWTFAQRYLELPSPHAPMIAMTAYTAELSATAAEVGAQDFLVKPLVLDTVLELVAHYAHAPRFPN